MHTKYIQFSHLKINLTLKILDSGPVLKLIPEEPNLSLSCLPQSEIKVRKSVRLCNTYCTTSLGAIFILRKDIGVGGWSRKWQISLTLRSEMSLRRWVGGLEKLQNTLT